ncbi:MAG: Ribonuclease P protein component 3 [Promethearchaeota archaeon]|nr:MAG: Ribonuclease P protein component 3 [Candidatus Lokiarchaeota archaeon]
MPYFESRLRINFESLDKIKEIFIICEKLGIQNLILEPSNDIIKIPYKLKEQLQKLTSIKLFYRFTLAENSVKELKIKLRKYNNCAEILAIESPNIDIQLFAATDTRVDLLSFSSYNILKTISQGVISLVGQNNKFVEFSLIPLTSNNRSFQSKAFRKLYRSLHMVLKNKTKFIISGNFHNLCDLRHPRALASISHTLIGIPLIEAKKAFSTNVELLVQTVLKRRNKNIFEEGVELI